MDWSTIDVEQLKKLRTYTLPPSYRLQDGCGNGCLGDPPGYPTYFTKCVYTKYGNSPHRGPQMVISFMGILYVVEHSDDWLRPQDGFKARQERLAKLWKPLPLDHPRTLAWMSHQERYFKNCYRDPRIPEKDRANADKLHIGMWTMDELPAVAEALGIKDIPTCVHEGTWPSEPAQVDELGHFLTRVRELTENGYLYLKQFYPDLTYAQYQQIAYSRQHPGNWWEVNSAPARTPEECDAQLRERYGRNGSFWRHPVNGTWCQQCGWHEGETE